MMRLSQNARRVTNSDGGVLLDLHHGKVFQMNGMGATVVELLANGSTEDRISVEISRRCGVDIAHVSADIHTFLASLKHFGLLDEDEESGRGTIA
jgi:coenzyme PQQ synthesis protein D (PqqD)